MWLPADNLISHMKLQLVHNMFVSKNHGDKATVRCKTKLLHMYFTITAV